MDQERKSSKDSGKESGNDIVKNKRFVPMVAAIAIAAVGLISLFVVDHGPWSRPHVMASEAHYATTASAAQAIGATVTPTDPKPALEPVAPGPKPSQPVNPAP